jgi:hypothetical protein
LLCLALTAPALAADQGEPCRTSADCSEGLKCILLSPARLSCERPCASAKDCPKSARCVRDGDARICRMIQPTKVKL